MTIELTPSQAITLINEACPFNETPVIQTITNPAADWPSTQVAYLGYDDPDTAGKTDDIASALHLTDPKQVDELRRALHAYDDNHVDETVRTLTRLGLSVTISMQATITVTDPRATTATTSDRATVDIDEAISLIGQADTGTDGITIIGLAHGDRYASFEFDQEGGKAATTVGTARELGLTDPKQVIDLYKALRLDDHGDIADKQQAVDILTLTGIDVDIDLPGKGVTVRHQTPNQIDERLDSLLDHPDTTH
ncbi:hypothetical protein CSQ85_12280 [Bifidobacterium rousetti]|uniref:hypothetical protein n=1 Tax=Bifidobacterium rousetti TaxID=2045439 RepID=UPI00123C44B7|nr:hypothetical protein [Bifidobacterium rousetti]KAA8815699.1 hypothetical protein CSQ85_12280 [Bifidobacterium rousetti]